MRYTENGENKPRLPIISVISMLRDLQASFPGEFGEIGFQPIAKDGSPTQANPTDLRHCNINTRHLPTSGAWGVAVVPNKGLDFPTISMQALCLAGCSRWLRPQTVLIVPWRLMSQPAEFDTQSLEPHAKGDWAESFQQDARKGRERAGLQPCRSDSLLQHEIRKRRTWRTSAGSSHPQSTGRQSSV